MISPLRPLLTADEATSQLQSVSNTLHTGLLAAIERSREFFASQDDGGHVDPYLFSHLVRYYLKEELSSLAETEPSLHVLWVPNTGLHLRYAHYEIRIWKTGEEGELPPPGTSGTRQQFYEQEQVFLPFYPEELDALCLIRLAYVWNVDEHLSFSELYLTCPKGSDSPWKPGTCHWSRRITAAKISVAEDIEELDLALDQTNIDAGE